MHLSSIPKCRSDVRTLIAAVCAFASLTPQALAQSNAPARFVYQGSFYRYGFFGKGVTTDVFGPAEDSFGISYQFDDGSATNRMTTSEISLVGMGGTLSLDLMNDSMLRARRLDGNDYGGGFSAGINVYVKAPPNTPFYIKRSLEGSASIIRGGGLGTTQAKMASVTAVLNNGSGGTQTLPVNIQQARTFAGYTSAAAHPSDPEYHFATGYNFDAWGFTFQSIDICFPSCPALLDFRSTSELSGTIEAGPCSPQATELDKWNAEPYQTGIAERSNNCYNYATNRRTDTFAQPGGDPNYARIDCETISNAAAADGFVPITLGDPDGCAGGQSVVALVIAPREDNYDLFEDYHWYRRNADRTWSHKPGGTPATNLDSSGNVITDPQTADRRFKLDDDNFLPGYTVFCGYFCVPCEFDLDSPLPLLIPQDPRYAPSISARLLVSSGMANPFWDIEEDAVRAAILAKIAAAPVVGPVPRPSVLGYAGFSLQPAGGLADFPDIVDVYAGTIRIEDAGIVEYRSDVDELEGYLVSLASAVGLGGLISGPRCPADYNGTPDAGDILDFLDFLQDFSDCTNLPAPCGQFGDPDLNGDTIIDILDFLDFLEAFGGGC